MWYKEWVEVVKTRLIVQAIGFGLIDLGYILLQLWDNAEMGFASWFVLAVLMLAVFSLLFNLDIVSREQNGGTLSFLLVRPIERRRVYTTKLLLNLTVSVGLFLVMALPILFVASDSPVALGRSFSLLGLGISFGILTACAGGLSSAINRLSLSHPNKISGSLVLFGTLGLLVFLIVNYDQGGYMYSNIAGSQPLGNLALSLVLLGLSAALYFVGLRAFNTVEV